MINLKIKIASLKKENEILKSHIEILKSYIVVFKNDRKDLIKKVEDLELKIENLKPDFDKETLIFLQNQFKNLLDLDISDEKIKKIYYIIILDFLKANGIEVPF